MASREGFDGDEPGPRDGHDNELGNPVADRDRIRHRGVGIQKRDPDLAAVAGIDGARAIDDGDAVFRRKTAAGYDESCESVGKGDGDSGTHGRTFTGSELYSLGRDKVSARIARVRVNRHLPGRNEYLNGISHVLRVVQNTCTPESRMAGMRSERKAQRKVIE